MPAEVLVEQCAPAAAAPAAGQPALGEAGRVALRAQVLTFGRGDAVRALPDPALKNKLAVVLCHLVQARGERPVTSPQHCSFVPFRFASLTRSGGISFSCCFPRSL